MGRYSESDDSDYRLSRRSKKKRRSRSRSRSDDSSYSSHSRHKKKKTKRSKRSSRSPRRKRSRSRSRDRRRRSRSRSSRSRSKSRSRRSRSRSHDRRRRSRSRSRSRDKRRSSSNGRFSPKNESSRSSFKIESDPSSVPGFDTMTPLEQNEVRMQLALKAADLAAERLKAAGVLDSGAAGSSSRTDVHLAAEDLDKRRKAIESIESDTFKQVQFKSSVKNQTSSKKTSLRRELELSHDAAIFGDLLAGTGMDAGAVTAKPKTLDIQDPKMLLGPVFFEPESEKLARWIDKLKSLRRHSHSNGLVS